MQRLLERARAYGVGVEFADLGDWGDDALCSEYDPYGPTIRIDARIADALAPDERERFVARAIGHELYHHRERIGEVRRHASRDAREREADAYALASLDASPA